LFESTDFILVGPMSSQSLVRFIALLSYLCINDNNNNNNKNNTHTHKSGASNRSGDPIHAHVHTPFESVTSLQVAVATYRNIDQRKNIKLVTPTEGVQADTMWPLLELKARAPWRRQISVSPCEEPRGVAPDVVIHLGGHICMRRHIVLASHLWLQHDHHRDSSDEEIRLLESSVKEIFRDVFRDRWSRDDMQWIMTNCSNYMIWTVRDVGKCDGIPSRILQLAAEVASEYVSAFQGVDEIGHVHDIGKSACLVRVCVCVSPSSSLSSFNQQQQTHIKGTSRYKLTKA